MEPDSPAFEQLSIGDKDGEDAFDDDSSEEEEQPATKKANVANSDESDIDFEDESVKKSRRSSKEKGKNSTRERSLYMRTSIPVSRKKKPFNLFDNPPSFRDRYRDPPALRSPPSMEEKEYSTKATNADKLEHVRELNVKADKWMDDSFAAYSTDLEEAQVAQREAVDAVYVLEDRLTVVVQAYQELQSKAGIQDLEVKKRDAEIQGLKNQVAQNKKLIKILEGNVKRQEKELMTIKSQRNKKTELDFIQEKSNISVEASRRRKEDALIVKEKADQAVQQKKSAKLQMAKQQFQQTRSAGGAPTGNMADFVMVCLFCELLFVVSI